MVVKERLNVWITQSLNLYGYKHVVQSMDVAGFVSKRTPVAIDTLLVVNQDITENEWGDEMKGSA